jgi:hypothetical protein
MNTDRVPVALGNQTYYNTQLWLHKWMAWGCLGLGCSCLLLMHTPQLGVESTAIET